MGEHPTGAKEPHLKALPVEKVWTEAVSCSWLGTEQLLDSSHECLQITAGVLVKYVNLGKGWRRRLFVLQGDVVRYYKARTELSAAAPALVLAADTRRLPGGRPFQGQRPRGAGQLSEGRHACADRRRGACHGGQEPRHDLSETVSAQTLLLKAEAS